MAASVVCRDMEIFEEIKKFGKSSIRKLAEALGLSKDKVNRGLQALSKRDLYPESEFWETPEGYQWLRMLIFAVLLEFGIKGNIGADRMSDFFKRIRLDKRIGLSPSSLRKSLKQMEELLADYQKTQENKAADKGREIIASGDETFFNDALILVLMDLSSGYILVEDKVDDRTHATWEEASISRLNQLKLMVRHFVSDRGKSLIKLAFDSFNCEPGADIFHGQYDISKWLGAFFYRRLGSINKEIKEIKESLMKSIGKGADPHRIEEKEEQLANAKEELNTLEAGKQSYAEAQQGVSKSVHPFALHDNKAQTSLEVESNLEKNAQDFEEISQTHSIDDPKNKLDKFRKQIEDIASIVDVWWLWAIESLVGYGLGKERQDWLLYTLLPVIYWHYQMERTQHSELRKTYKKAWIMAFKQWKEHPLTLTISDSELQSWLSWGEWIVSKFQRASSAVEGRNGCLAQTYHSGRGLTARRLKALTVVHNFDLKRRDGTTAAERLFDIQFPDLFGWLVEQMGDLPLARTGRQCRLPNPLNCKAVAA